VVHDSAYNTERTEEIEKAKRPEEEAGGDLRYFNIRNMSREERDCRETQTDTQSQTESRGRLTAKRREERKFVCQTKGGRAERRVKERPQGWAK